MVGCWAYGCSKRSESGVLFHSFPADFKIRKHWALKVNRIDPKTKRLLIPSQSAKLCQEHFDPSSYLINKAGKRKLSKDAVPTLLLRSHLPDTEEHTQPSASKRRKLGLNSPTTTEEARGDNSPELPDRIEDPPAESLVMRVKRLENELQQEKRKRRNAEKHLTTHQQSLQKIFGHDQLRALSRKTTRGLPWSTATIKKALCLRFSCGDTGYKNILSTGIPLPSVRTLQEKLQNIQFRPGLLSSVFDYLEIKIKAFEPRDRLCCLTLDEMQITSRVEFDAASKSVLGDITIPDHDGAANHALVLMLGGVCKRWKQVVAYYYTGDTIRGPALKSICLDTIRRASSVGLVVVAITCDMGPSNRAMWREFGITATRYDTISCIPHPCLDNRKLYFVADVPHLLKNLRSAWTTHKTIVLPDDIWQQQKLPCGIVDLVHVIDLIDFQSNKSLKLAPKLTMDAVNASHFMKMKVGIATHLFSSATGSALQYLVEKEGRPQSYLTTAWFVHKVHRWFQLMTSRHASMALSKLSEEKFEAACSSLVMFSSIIHKCQFGRKEAWKPIQTGIALSTTSILKLAEDLIGSDSQRFLMTSRLTQDCIENLFSSVRARNPVPTPREFKYALKIITVAQYLKSGKSTNYELDEREYLGDLLPSRIIVPNPEPDYSVIPTMELNSTNLEIPSDEQASLSYLVGYCVQSLKKSNQICKQYMSAVSDNSPQPHTTLIELKN